MEAEYAREFKFVEKYFRCSKYQIKEFKEEYNICGVDEYVLSFRPSEAQFRFLKENLAEQYKIKQGWVEAIGYLSKAKEVIKGVAKRVGQGDLAMMSQDVISDKEYVGSLEMTKFIKQTDTLSCLGLDTF